MNPEPFLDRAEAGRLLAAELAKLNLAQPAVFALPRGGVPVGVEIARALGAPLDLILVRKIGAPSQPELAAGAVVDGDPPVWNADVLGALGLSPERLTAIVERERGVIARRRALYRQDMARAPVAGCTAMLVDDGIATGATMRAAIAAMRTHAPARLVVAAPVAAAETAAMLRAVADDVVCLREPARFGAVGVFFRDFRQLSDDDVVALLDRRS